MPPPSSTAPGPPHRKIGAFSVPDLVVTNLPVYVPSASAVVRSSAEDTSRVAAGQRTGPGSGGGAAGAEPDGASLGFSPLSSSSSPEPSRPPEPLAAEPRPSADGAAVDAGAGAAEESQPAATRAIVASSAATPVRRAVTAGPRLGRGGTSTRRSPPWGAAAGG